MNDQDKGWDVEGTPIYAAMVADQRGHLDDAPTPATRMALAVAGFIGLLAIVLLVLAGLGWDAL